MKISIIIVTYKSDKDINVCIESIIKNTKVLENIEIIVVDNDSQDDIEILVNEIKEKYKKCKIIFKQMSYNSGFAKGCNEGVKLASGEKILFLNPDTEFINDVIGNIEYEIKQKNIDKYGVVGCKVLNSDNSIQGSIYKLPSFLSEIEEIFSINKEKEYSNIDIDYSTSQEVESLLGAIMYMDKELYMKIGMMSEEFFMYSEEVELCLRCNNNNYKNYYLSSPIIKHYGGKSAIKNLRESKSAYFDSKIILYKKIFTGYKKTILVALIKLKKILVMAKIKLNKGEI